MNGSKYKMDDPLDLHSSDHSSLVLVSDLLTEHNYQTWSRPMIIALQARDKVCFINGEFMKLAQEKDTFKQWVKVNATLISWILNVMSKNLARGFVYATDACTLWEEIKACVRFNQRSDYSKNQFQSARVVNQYQPATKPQGQRLLREDKSGYKCDHCQKKGHLRRDCFKLKGYPNWWPGVREQKQKERVNVTRDMDTPMECRVYGQASAKNMQSMITQIQQEVGKALKGRETASCSMRNEANLVDFDHFVEQQLIPVSNYKDFIVPNENSIVRKEASEEVGKIVEVTGTRKRKLSAWLSDYQINNYTSDGESCVDCSEEYVPFMANVYKDKEPHTYK
ncbi:hypothetical protein LIER_28303 [Lithospermum erythrorhizon]|uniref:CCHC-type domain-containing protein n=1 Tax=Lithospermum erythrorhizon TaxID=34254 RepID=A0AAV3RH51_LITER